jgi:HEAT repeat protein
MGSLVTDLVGMHDIEGLLRILDESEDWMDQMDAAEGLVQLGDRRGLEYLLVAKQSDIEEVQLCAAEILADPEVRSMREKIEAEMRFDSQKLVEAARERIKKGRKVFLHKVVHLSAADILQDDPSGNGFEIYDLNDAGLEGWELVSILPRRQFLPPGDSRSVGAYAFLRKELGPGDEAELEKK